MTALLVAFAVWAFLMATVVWPICVMAKRADERRHPSQWSPAGEEHMMQAVAIVDDGKALVRETEDYLRRRHA